LVWFEAPKLSGNKFCKPSGGEGAIATFAPIDLPMPTRIKFGMGDQVGDITPDAKFQSWMRLANM